MTKHVSASRHVAGQGNYGHPNAWLRELARIRKAPWDVGYSIRSALSIGLPWAICFATGSVTAAMWISFGALRASMSESNGDYRDRFRLVIGGPAIGTVGFLAGYLDSVPWVMTVTAMAAIGYLAGVLSRYGALLSIGATQALLIASLAIGLPAIPPVWESALLYLAGVALYAALLGIEALCSRSGQRRAVVIDLVAALGDLAAQRAVAMEREGREHPEVEEARRTVTGCFTTLGAAIMRASSQHFGPRGEADRLAAILAHSDATFVAIMASEDRAALQVAAVALQAAAAARPVPPVEVNGPMGAALTGVIGCLGKPGNVSSSATDKGTEPSGMQMSRRARIAIDRITPSPMVMRSAAAVAVCLGIAYAARWLDSTEHWFWIPLTVGLVMKPDLGSVFARAVLRVAGTIIGAAIGAVVLILLPKGVWLALPIALFAGLLPTAMRRSFALQAAAVTPLVLILVSAIEPGPIDVDYCIQRIFDTMIGGAIALVFGYFIWPRSHFDELADGFGRAKQRIAGYILDAASCDDQPADRRLPAARREAYRDLAEIRTYLRTALAEPPPASDEATTWFPLIAGAERICDHVTAYTTRAQMPVSPADAEALRELAAFVAATPDDRRQRPAPSSFGCSVGVVTLLAEIECELQHMDRLRDDHAFQAISNRRRG